MTISSRALPSVIFLSFLIVVSFSLCARAQNTPPPSWVYSTYFGGSGADSITVAARDSAGSLYVAGVTSSANFPTTAGVYEPTYPGPTGANVIFVSKFSAEGALAWSTFLGPGSTEFIVPSGLAVDPGQNVYISGIFQGSGFPTTSGLPNSGSVFVVKLNATGSQLAYSGMIGGNSTAGNPAIVLDNADNAFVTGSGDICCNGNTGIIGPLGGISDFWVAEIAAAGNAIPWSVEIGGTDMDIANGLTIDAANKLYVTGYTASSDFPFIQGSLKQPGPDWAFVDKLDPAQQPTSSLVYTALVGNLAAGNNNPYIEGDSVAVDALGNAYVGAWTYNPGLVTSRWAFQSVALGEPNVYVFEVSPSGAAISNGTYIGGSSPDFIKQVGIDTAGNIYVGGFTSSLNFPLTAYGDNGQAYYVKLNPQFAAVSSVQFGGSGDPATVAAVPDGVGDVWVAGYDQGGLPTTTNAYQPSFQGSGDGFLVHTDFAPLCGDGEGTELCSITADPNLSERINFIGQAGNVEQTIDSTLTLDGMVAYGIHAAQFDAWLPVAPGKHTASITALTVGGQQSKASQAFTVAASTSCPLNPVTPSLTLCRPLNAAVIKGSINVQAVANDAAPPSAVQLFVDGKFIALIQGKNGSYVYSLQLPSGVHHILVQGNDKQNSFLTTTAVVRVAE